MRWPCDDPGVRQFLRFAFARLGGRLLLTEAVDLFPHRSEVTLVLRDVRTPGLDNSRAVAPTQDPGLMPLVCNWMQGCYLRFGGGCITAPTSCPTRGCN